MLEIQQKKIEELISEVIMAVAVDALIPLD